MKAKDLTSVFRSAIDRIVDPECDLQELLTDSRKMRDAEHSLFFAITTKRNSGCKYIEGIYAKGVRNFVVPFDSLALYQERFEELDKANFWYVKDVVMALQQLVAVHRAQFQIPVVGVTGSNGKTIVKDWIVQMLSDDKKVVSSPKSYNSQIGVPLSVWQMSHDHEVAVFEAGISEPGEMERLRSVIAPTIGIFTNIGQAHDEHFLSRQQKIAEKLQLFTHCDTLIYCADHKEIQNALSEVETFRHVRLFSWGKSADNEVQLVETTTLEHSTKVTVRYQDTTSEIVIPFLDRASLENAMHCITLLLCLGYSNDDVARKCLSLTPVSMRLEMGEGVNNCLLINDSYSLDVNSLIIALDFMQHDRQHFNKTLIMSDFMQTGMAEQDLYVQVANMLHQYGVNRFIGVGDALIRNKVFFSDMNAVFYPSTASFLRDQDVSEFENETILLKGARDFHFEDIAKMLQRKLHETIMEVNLDAMVRNLNYYRSLIKPTTKLMAMVKAASYGAGKVEIASTLQYNHVDYLTVAYADEGVELRRNGITLPIMVMNPEEESFDVIVRYKLEPDIYSFRVFERFSETARLMGSDGRKIPVHVEFDTGMHRLGFSGSDIVELVNRFSAPDCVLEVQSIFSHLACSEDPEMDAFTQRQIDLFKEWSGALKSGLHKEDICCHILNSSGITRFTDAQMDMVRLGIGLYGIAPDAEVQKQLTPVSRLKTRISQIKPIPKGDSVGYNRRWIAQRDSMIAIIPIGYADGLNRRLGYERGKVSVGGSLVPIIGSVCMDMCFLDVTGVPCQEGDDVIIFGDATLLQEISDAADTIPYEILTSVSPRVKRVYYQE
ncbi:MAG: bifunctional UDP-N-acetylmuramoyl-tripeptide:D-alanyl-D-alanine ligase/alanine racemase [Bacteroidales bacterium]|nr:bifunctional UDP-N-acetylmuramoyl-tripeptide:D-alanyl-D-alanine ligase/alanine racemase [Bacteroidales bacterium]